MASINTGIVDLPKDQRSDDDVLVALAGLKQVTYGSTCFLAGVSRGGLGHLAAWHLPDGPVGPASRWAATSNVEVGHTTYPGDRERVGREGREGSEGQSHKEEEREGGTGMREDPYS